MNEGTETDFWEDGEAIDRAARQAVHDALREHRRLGQEIVVWRGGKIVTVRPEEINPPPLDEETSSGMSPHPASGVSLP